MDLKPVMLVSFVGDIIIQKFLLKHVYYSLLEITLDLNCKNM